MPPFDRFEKVALNPQPLPPVEVTIPSAVLFDIDQFEKVQRDILGKLGCPGCNSGFDIRYLTQRRFEVNENLEVQVVTEIVR